MGFESHGKTFKSGNSVAVGLPEDFGFGADVEVTLRQVGDAVMVERRRKLSFAEALELLRTLPKPSQPGVREKIEFPERPGL